MDLDFSNNGLKILYKIESKPIFDFIVSGIFSITYKYLNVNMSSKYRFDF